jgi:hypothetical protein
MFKHLLEKVKDQLLYHLMIELLDKFSVTQNQEFVFLIKLDQANYLMPSLKVLMLIYNLENN